MTKAKFSTATLILLLTINNPYQAHGADSCAGTSTCAYSECSIVSKQWTPGACKSASYTYYDKYGIKTCYQCYLPYIRVTKTAEVPGCGTYSYWSCECECSTSEWTTLSPGYETRTVCGDTCKVSTEYRCAKGYYGRPTNSGTTGCTRCPALEDTYGTTSTAAKDSITSCYIPSNTGAFKDPKGTYQFRYSCYYKN